MFTIPPNFNVTDVEPKPTKKQPWGWKIIKDKVEDGKLVGKTYRDYQGGKHKYRLKDDDGEIYYYFLSDIDPNEGYENQIFAPLDWAMNYAGAAILEYKDAKTGEYEMI